MGGTVHGNVAIEEEGCGFKFPALPMSALVHSHSPNTRPSGWLKTFNEWWWQWRLVGAGESKNVTVTTDIGVISRFFLLPLLNTWIPGQCIRQPSHWAHCGPGQWTGRTASSGAGTRGRQDYHPWSGLPSHWPRSSQGHLSQQRFWPAEDWCKSHIGSSARRTKEGGQKAQNWNQSHGVDTDPIFGIVSDVILYNILMNWQTQPIPHKWGSAL